VNPKNIDILLTPLAGNSREVKKSVEEARKKEETGGGAVGKRPKNWCHFKRTRKTTGFAGSPTLFREKRRVRGKVLPRKGGNIKN